MSKNEKCYRCGAIGYFGRSDGTGAVCDDCFQEQFLGIAQDLLSKREDQASPSSFEEDYIQYNGFDEGQKSLLNRKVIFITILAALVIYYLFNQ